MDNEKKQKQFNIASLIISVVFCCGGIFWAGFSTVFFSVDISSLIVTLFVVNLLYGIGVLTLCVWEYVKFKSIHSRFAAYGIGFGSATSVFLLFASLALGITGGWVLLLCWIFAIGVLVAVIIVFEILKRKRLKEEISGELLNEKTGLVYVTVDLCMLLAQLVLWIVAYCAFLNSDKYWIVELLFVLLFLGPAAGLCIYSLVTRKAYFEIASFTSGFMFELPLFLLADSYDYGEFPQLGFFIFIALLFVVSVVLSALYIRKTLARSAESRAESEEVSSETRD